MTSDNEATASVTAVINGDKVQVSVSVRRSLVDWIRHDIGLTGSHVGCEHGVCGACNMIVDGRVIRGCLMLAVQADGAVVDTIDSGAPARIVLALQNAFFDRAALQCGFCTPGMILQASELLRLNKSPTRSEIRNALSGNYCRCTGYHAIVDAVHAAAAALRSGDQNE